MKKSIFKLFCNPFIGKIISIIFWYNIPNLKNGFKRFKTPKLYCNDTVRAMIFWGFYEGAEIRLIRKYLPGNLPVVELGSSLGIVSSTAIGCIDVGTSYTCVEANPYLTEYINYNITKHNPSNKNYKIINSAVAYNSNGYILMNISNNNTESSIINSSNLKNECAIKVKAISLSEISITDFTLICDIEGAEIEIFKNDYQILENCKHLFIELHKTIYHGEDYAISDLQTIIEKKLLFKLVASDGNVFYYNK